MATIVSSTLDADANPQADGRYYVREHHLDSLGVRYDFEYLADALMDRAAIMAARAATLISMAQAAELRSVIVEDLPIASLQYSTALQAAQMVRSYYQLATREELAIIANWILDRISAGEVTDAQVQNVFGLTAGQWSTLKTKMQNLVAAYNTVLSAVGE